MTPILFTNSPQFLARYSIGFPAFISKFSLHLRHFQSFSARRSLAIFPHGLCTSFPISWEGERGDTAKNSNRSSVKNVIKFLLSRCVQHFTTCTSPIDLHNVCVRVSKHTYIYTYVHTYIHTHVNLFFYILRTKSFKSHLIETSSG